MIVPLVLALLLPQQPVTYDLRVKGKVGDTYAVRMSANITPIGAEGTMNFTMVMTQKLKLINDKEAHWNVVYKLEKAEDSGVFKGAAAQFADLDGLEVLMKQDRFARPSTVNVSGTEIKNEGDANVTFPPKPAEIGSEWVAKIDLAGQKVPITYRLDKVAMHEGKMAAFIIGAFPKGSIATNIKPTRFIVELANGIMLKSEGTSRVKIGQLQVQVEYAGSRL